MKKTIAPAESRVAEVRTDLVSPQRQLYRTRCVGWKLLSDTKRDRNHLCLNRNVMTFLSIFLHYVVSSWDVLSWKGSWLWSTVKRLAYFCSGTVKCVLNIQNVIFLIRLQKSQLAIGADTLSILEMEFLILVDWILSISWGKRVYILISGVWRFYKIWKSNKIWKLQCRKWKWISEMIP